MTDEQIKKGKSRMGAFLAWEKARTPAQRAQSYRSFLKKCEDQFGVGQHPSLRRMTLALEKIAEDEAKKNSS